MTFLLNLIQAPDLQDVKGHSAGVEETGSGAMDTTALRLSKAPNTRRDSPSTITNAALLRYK